MRGRALQYARALVRVHMCIHMHIYVHNIAVWRSVCGSGCAPGWQWVGTVGLTSHCRTRRRGSRRMAVLLCADSAVTAALCVCLCVCLCLYLWLCLLLVLVLVWLWLWLWLWLWVSLRYGLWVWV